MVSKSVKGMLKKAAVAVMLTAMIASVCACSSVKSKRQLINYANETYGKCTLIGAHSNGKGTDAITEVHLQDNETGIEYTVTSSLVPVTVDGSTFGYHEQTTSDFERLYYEYLLDEAEYDLALIESSYDMSYSFKGNVFILTFNDREGGDNARECAAGFDETLAEYDVKKMRPCEYLLYVDNVYIGSYDSENDDYVRSRDYYIVDYVHTNYDPDAKYSTSLGCYLSEFLSYEEIDRLLPDHDGTPSGTAYYFTDKDGDMFVAICLDDFGIKDGGVRLFRDKAYGMEEIDY